MPPQGKKEERRFCPYCSGEYAEGYLWLHKRDYCPLRPGRREQLNAEAMGISGLSIPPGQMTGANVTGTIHQQQYAGATAAPVTPNAIEGAMRGPIALTQYNNITPINLMEEYQNMVKVMQKKKEEEVEIGEEYQCGGCNTTWHGQKAPKHCPECGIEFG